MVQVTFDEWFDVVLAEEDSHKEYTELEDMYYDYLSEIEEDTYEMWKDDCD